MADDSVPESLRAQLSSMHLQLQEVRSALAGGLGDRGLRIRVEDLERQHRDMNRLVDNLTTDQRQRDEDQRRRDRRINALLSGLAATAVTTLLGLVLNLLAGGGGLMS